MRHEQTVGQGSVPPLMCTVTFTSRRMRRRPTTSRCCACVLKHSPVILSTFGPHANNQFFFQKRLNYCPESENYSSFCRKRQEISGKSEKLKKNSFVSMKTLWVDGYSYYAKLIPHHEYIINISIGCRKSRGNI